MVVFRVNSEISPRLVRILSDLAPETRRAILSVGANALRIEIRRHIRADVPRRHVTASGLGASPTGHLSKGAARITSHSTGSRAEVSVPIAGITRAYRDLEIRPVRAKSLTIPIADVSYGHRARELARMGWRIFRLPKTDILAGSRNGETRALYALKKRVTVRQDRSLLPSDEKIRTTINDAMARRIMEIIGQ